MSVIVETRGADARAVAIGNAWSVGELLKEIHSVLALQHDVECYDVAVCEGADISSGGGVEATASLADVGIHGSDERIHISLKREVLARERLRGEMGITDSSSAAVAMEECIKKRGDAVAQERVGLIAESQYLPAPTTFTHAKGLVSADDEEMLAALLKHRPLQLLEFTVVMNQAMQTGRIRMVDVIMTHTPGAAGMMSHVLPNPASVTVLRKHGVNIPSPPPGMLQPGA